MTRQLGLSIAAGLLSAILFLTLAKGIALGALLSYAAPLPLIMAGLGLGWSASVIAGVAMLAAVAAVAGVFFVLPIAIGVVLPALVVANRSVLCRTDAEGTVHWYPPGLVLAWLTVAGLVLLLIGMALLASGSEGVQAGVADLIGRTLDMIAQGLAPQDRDKVVTSWTSFFPAMVIGSWLVMAVINALGAQALLVRMGRARRPSPIYRELWLPDWLGIGLTVAVVVAVLARGDVGYVATNVLVVLLIPFAFLGLADIHRRAFGKHNARLILVLAYGLLFLANGAAAAAVAGLGLVRFWTMRFRRPESGGGMEG